MLPVSLFNVARYLTDSLRGPVLQTLRRARKREFDGVGRVGRVDGHQKCPLIFFVLRYIKHFTHIYIFIYKKNVLANFLWVWKFGQVVGSIKKIKNTLVV